MKKIISFLAVSAMVWACACSENGAEVTEPDSAQSSEPAESSVPQPVAKQFRLATYNVGAFNKTEASSIFVISNMMKEITPDAISLNELDSCTTRTNQVFQLKDFATKMGDWDYTFAQAIPYKGGGYGIGIASDPKLNLLRRARLSLDREDGSEQRACAVEEFEDFVFMSTHLDHKSAAAQLHQAQTIEAWVAENYGSSPKPVFLCGDFNALPTSETILFMKQNWTVISPEGYTYSAVNPKKCIDYIMVYKNASFRVTAKNATIATAFSTGDVTTASDHLPVYLDVIISPK